ncbi:MAG TPA: spore germination protein GerPC, partial [Bacillales bacterium]|nr:spore germination protein GerPC [Bacillales bacterium]
LDEFSVNGDTIQTSPAQDPGLQMMQSARQDVNQYLTGDAQNDMKQIENRLGYPLDGPYRKFILQDLQKQVDPRLRHYYSELNPEIKKNPRPEVAQQMAGKVKQDIYQGMENFISKLTQGSED